MEPYATNNYPEIPLDNRSLVVAFANLLQKFGMDTEPIQLNIELTEEESKVDWWSLPEQLEGIETMQVIDQPGSWPNTSHAIVKFRRTDPVAAGPVAHYCLVADYRNMTIVDSLDGQVKPASTYGTVLGWCSYINESLISDVVKPVDPNSIYVVQEPFESAWEIARKLNIQGITANDLIDHNDIETPVKIPAGTLLHLPIIPQKAAEATKSVEFEILETPLLMHVTKDGGTTKFSFGNVKKWKDIKPTGPTYPVNTNLKIVAIAHVPIDEDKSEAAYYMDSVSLGQYAVNQRVAYTTGFNHTHLAEGHVEKPKVAPTPALKAVKQVTAEVIARDLETIEPGPVIPDWKQSKRPISNTGKQYTYTAIEDILVQEMDGRRQPRPLERGRGVKLAYLFEKDGITYGLPASHSLNGFWYGIPMDKLMLKSDAVYTVSRVPINQKSTKLSLEERAVVVLSKVLSQYTRLTSSIFGKRKK